MHAYLAKRYAIPLTTTVLTIPQIVEDLVTYDIYRLLANADGGLQSINPDFVQERRTDALGILKDISDGKADVFDSAGNRVLERNLVDKFFVTTQDYAQTFNLDSDLSWAVSSKRLNSIESDRLANG